MKFEQHILTDIVNKFEVLDVNLIEVKNKNIIFHGNVNDIAFLMSILVSTIHLLKSLKYLENTPK